MKCRNTEDGYRELVKLGVEPVKLNVANLPKEEQFEAMTSKGAIRVIELLTLPFFESWTADHAFDVLLDVLRNNEDYFNIIMENPVNNVELILQGVPVQQEREFHPPQPHVSKLQDAAGDYDSANYHKDLSGEDAGDLLQ